MSADGGLLSRSEHGGGAAPNHCRGRVGQDKDLAHRVAHLIEKGADPSRIFLLTFSKRAAAEMKRRVEALVARNVNSQLRLPWAGTFHTAGGRLVCQYADSIGINPAFTILDRNDSGI
jgi:DNA helicase-2/ATP-dependent DNA helicase PcrA